ncbi:hypothetical protein ANCCEY_06427 [Ancylostoma ceylanicum]|uniref:Uncharacterized protein n=1 Tax=Ancylostoma ceylanicum TaxID=53326 RepID=A0A0D6LRH9_9BILA|nr:hypothetical protein ANCCEY_06427 [Ancylostoma ceylanicum]
MALDDKSAMPCDKKIPDCFKSKVYRAVVRSIRLYESAPAQISCEKIPFPNHSPSLGACKLSRRSGLLASFNAVVIDEPPVGKAPLLSHHLIVSAAQIGLHCPDGASYGNRTREHIRDSGEHTLCAIDTCALGLNGSFAVKEKAIESRWSVVPYKGFIAGSPSNTFNEIVSLA